MKQDLPAAWQILNDFLPFLFPNFGFSLDILSSTILKERIKLGIR